MSNFYTEKWTVAYFEMFPPKSMNVSTKTIDVPDASGALVRKRIMVAAKDFTAGDIIYKVRFVG